MTTDAAVIGLVLARGGSKGVPGKNLREVAGKPLLVHAVECGLACPSISRVVVSTDSAEIASVARAAGASVPFMRPAELAGDTVGALPVMRHALIESERAFGERFDCAALLDPTSPLRTENDVEGALALWRAGGCDAVISGTPARRNPYFNVVTLVNGYAAPAASDGRAYLRRQDAPPVFDLDTTIWVYSRDAVLAGTRLPPRTRLYVVPRERSWDIDSELDLEIAEKLMARRDAR